MELRLVLKLLAKRTKLQNSETFRFFILTQEFLLKCFIFFHAKVTKYFWEVENTLRQPHNWYLSFFPSIFFLRRNEKGLESMHVEVYWISPGEILRHHSTFSLRYILDHPSHISSFESLSKVCSSKVEEQIETIVAHDEDMY